jgi:hypothetical protein
MMRAPTVVRRAVLLAAAVFLDTVLVAILTQAGVARLSDLLIPGGAYDAEDLHGNQPKPTRRGLKPLRRPAGPGVYQFTSPDAEGSIRKGL